MISGYLWLVFFFLAFHDDLPGQEEAPPTLQPLFDLGHDLSALGLATVSGVAAYLFGSAVQELLKLVCGALPGKSFYGEAGTHLSAAGRADVQRAVVVRVQAIRRRLFQVALSPGEKGVDEEPSPQAVERELPLIRTLLLGEHGDLIAELDRLQAEADLRIMVALPLIVFSVYLAVEVSAGWLLALPAAALLLAQGHQRQVEVGDLLAKALRIGKVSAPSLESLDASAAAAVERIELEEDLARKVSDGQSPMAAFRLGNLQATGENFEAAIASLRFAAENGVIHAYAEIGLVYEQVGELDDAERAYRDGEKRKDRRAAERLAGLLRKLERGEEALETVRRAQEQVVVDPEEKKEIEPNVPSERARIADYRLRAEQGDAKAALNLGLLHQRRGQWEEAVHAFREATSLDSGDAQAWLALGYALGEMRRSREAVDAYQQALEILERTLGGEHLEVASALGGLGVAKNELGQVEEAKLELERALAIQEKAVGPDSVDVAITLGNLAISQATLGELSAAEEMAERVLAIKERHLSPDHPRVAISLRHLAVTYTRTGKYLKAKQLLERAVAIDEGASGSKERDAAVTLEALASTLDVVGEYPRARALHERALEMKGRTLGEEHQGFGISLLGLGNSLRGLGEYEKGLRTQERALAILRRSDASALWVADAYQNCSEALRSLERSDEALTMAESAIAILEEDSSGDDLHRGGALVEVGEALNAVGRFARAQEPLERGLGLFEKTVGSDHLYQVPALLGLGRSMRGLGNRSSAERYLRTALKILDEAPVEIGPARAEVLLELGEILQHQGRLEEAKTSILQSISLLERSTSSFHPELANAFEMLASVLDVIGGVSEAAAARDRAEEIRGGR